jgi:SSS family transporter
MKTLELAITLGYIVVCILIGVWVSRRVSESSDDYWVAGRKIGTFTNSWALMAALGSGGSILGVNGLAYKLGIPYTFAMYAGAVAGFPLAAILVARQLRNFRVRTVPEFLDFRYNNKVLNIIVPLVILVCMEVYVVAQLKAAGVTAVYLLGIPYKTAVVLTALVFTLYVSIGGMWAVTLTDVLQGILMVTMVVVVAIAVFMGFGGFTSTVQQGAAAFPALGAVVDKPVISYAGAFLVWFIAACTVPHLVMRVFTARDGHSARLSLNYSMLIYAVMIFFGVIAIASAGHVLFPDLQDADTVFLKVLEHYIPSRIMAGLAVAAVMAAVMSTTDALILAVSSAAVNDIYKKHFNPQADEKTIFKMGLIMTWVAGLLAVYFALNPPKLLTMLYTAAVGLLGSTLFAPIILGIWWKKATAQGALWSCISGGVSYLYLLWFSSMPALSHVLVSVPLSFVVFFVVSLATQSSIDPQVLERVAIGHERELQVSEAQAQS